MEQTSKKKMIIIVLGTAFIIILLLLFITLLIFSRRKEKTIKQEPISTVNTFGDNEEKTNQQNNSQAGWTVGQGATYTVQYPPDWQVHVASVSGGGTATTFQSPDDTFPRFYIEATATTSATPISQRLQTLSWMHLPQSTVTIQGAPGIMLSGTVPMQPLPDNPNQNSISKVYLFFEKNGTQYVITETYYNDTNAKTNARLLEAILSSMQF